MNKIRKMIYENMCEYLVSVKRLTSDGEINAQELHDVLVGKKVPTLLFLDAVAKNTAWEDVVDYVSEQQKAFENHICKKVDFNNMDQSDIIQLFSWEQMNPDIISMKDKYKPVYDEDFYTVTNYLIEVAHKLDKGSIKMPTKSVIEAVLATVPKQLMSKVLDLLSEVDPNAGVVTKEMVRDYYRATREEFSITRNELIDLLDISNGLANKYESGIVKPSDEHCELVANYINKKIAGK